MNATRKDLAVIGAGPGGYVAALRASQLGLKTVLFEADRIGGTCMNYGCIPTKALLHQTKTFRDVRRSRTLEGPLIQVVLNWSRVQEEKRKTVDRLVRGVELLLQRGGIEIVRGTAGLVDERRILARQGEEEKTFEAERIILATGSRSADLPFLKADGRDVVTSFEALDFETIPRSLLVVGAGAIGLEMGTIYSRMGTDVTILEIMPQVLPGSDKESAARLEVLLKRQGLKIFTQMAIERAERDAGGGMTLHGTCRKNGTPFSFKGDRVLLAAGRRANSDRVHAASPVVPINRLGFVEVNERLETSIPGIFAIGDLIGGKLLAHKASHEGLAAASAAAGRPGSADTGIMPMAVFTDPEFASVGLTEEEARSGTGEIRTGIFSFQANGRALTMESPEGQVKIIAGSDDRILGAHILGPCASDLIAELTLAMRRGLKIMDVASTVHIHPTLSEAVMEAALKVHGEAIHIVNA